MNIELKQLQSVELDMLKEFIKICNKYSLRYFLLGGSCLGAVRHKGFIPWDDDIDVGMPRKDYDFFLSIAQKELPKHLFIQTHQTDPEYIMNFTKIRNSRTTFIEKEVAQFRINHGVYMDIFPLDGYTNNKILKKIFRKKKSVLISATYKKFSKGNETKKHRSIKSKAAGILADIYRDTNKLFETKEKLYRKYDYDKSEIVANHNGAWGEKEIVPKAYFGNGRNGVFEGVEVVLPENYDSYLTALYGDYMTPPPAEKQKGHHSYVALNLQKSYLEYMK